MADEWDVMHVMHSISSVGPLATETDQGLIITTQWIKAKGCVLLDKCVGVCVTVWYYSVGKKQLGSHTWITSNYLYT